MVGAARMAATIPAMNVYPEAETQCPPHRWYIEGGRVEHWSCRRCGASKVVDRRQLMRAASAPAGWREPRGADRRSPAGWSRGGRRLA